MGYKWGGRYMKANEIEKCSKTAVSKASNSCQTTYWFESCNLTRVIIQSSIYPYIVVTKVPCDKATGALD